MSNRKSNYKITPFLEKVFNESEDKFNFDLMLERLKQELYQDNLRDLLVDTKSLDTKIEHRYAELKLIDPNQKMSLEEYRECVYEAIRNWEVDTILLYIKQPSRQNPYEHLQLKILRYYFKTNIKQFNRIRFDGTKSVDGISEDGKTMFQCKYINIDGGNQKNQFNDLTQFNINQNEYETNYLVVSGPYAKKTVENWVKTTKLAPNTKIIVLDETITFIDNETTTPIDKETMARKRQSEDMKRFNKFYSIVPELIENVNLNDLLSRFNDSMTLIEPFAGDCDLLNMFKGDLLKTDKVALIELFDITAIDDSNIKSLESKIPNIDKYENYDSLKDEIFDVDGAPYFVITNPPYTAKNKLDEETKRKYKQIMTDIQDLYQIFIKQLINKSNLINGGCVIIPSNFMFGNQSRNLRNQFLSVFDIVNLSIFERQMFDYTTQSVITLTFIRKDLNHPHEHEQPLVKLYTTNEVKTISPEDFTYILNFDFQNEFRVSGGNSVIIKRNYNINAEAKMFVSGIKVSLLDPKIEAYIDTNNKDVQDKETDRAYMRLCFDKQFDLEQETNICKLFNDTLNNLRKRTSSLVLTSYREYSRKRLSFEEVYIMMNHVISHMLT